METIFKMNDKDKLQEVMHELCFLEGFNKQIANNDEQFISELGKTNLKRITLIQIVITELINK